MLWQPGWDFERPLSIGFLKLCQMSQGVEPMPWHSLHMSSNACPCLRPCMTCVPSMPTCEIDDLPCWPAISLFCTCPAAVPASDDWQVKRQQRLEGIAPRGHAMADDEVLFHLEHILEFHRRIPSSSQQVVRQFVHIPPLTVCTLVGR